MAISVGINGVGDLEQCGIFGEFCAINAKTLEVTFNQAPETAPVKEDFTIEGLEVKSVNAKSGSDKVFVITTDAQVAGQSYTLVYGTQEVAFTAVVEVAELEAVKTALAQQVGKNAEVEYKVLDQNGDPIANKEIYFRARGDINAGIEVIEKTAKSDANGIVKFSFTRNDEGTDGLTAYVVDQPLVRNTDVRVTWTIAPAGLIDVAASHSGKVGHNTILEYDITAKDLDGVALDRGEIIDLKLELNSTNAGNATTPQVDIQRTNGTWETVTAEVGGEYLLELKEVGKAKVRVVYPNQAVEEDLVKSFDVTPKFQYDLDKNGTINADDPIAIAPRVTFVKQNPTFTLTPENDNNLVSLNGKKEFTLKVVDQFGNPYNGKMKLGALGTLDGLSGTEDPANTFDIKIDSDNDGVFEKTKTINNDSLDLDFKFETHDLDDDGEITLQVSSAQTNKFTLVVFYDADGNGFVGAKDPQAKSAELTFGEVAPSKITLETKTPTAAVGADVVYKARFLDSEGEKFIPEAQIGFALYNVKAKAYEDLALTDVELKDSDGNDLKTPNAKVTKMGKNLVLNADVDSEVTIEIKTAKIAAIMSANSDHTDFKLVAYSENGTADGVIQLDEYKVESEFLIEAAQATKGELTSTDVTNKAKFAFEDGSDYEFAAASGDKVEYIYTTQDQSGEDFGAPADGSGVRAIWTITNNTDEDAKLNYSNATGDTVTDEVLKAGKTVTVDTLIAASSAETKLNVTSDANASGLIDVKAQTNVATTVAESTTLVYDAKVDTAAAEVTYSGTVKAINTNPTGVKANAKTDKTQFVISTPVGEVVVDTLANNLTPEYIINGNTADEALFEKQVKIGSTVSVEGNGTNLTITLK